MAKRNKKDPRQPGSPPDQPSVSDAPAAVAVAPEPEAAKGGVRLGPDSAADQAIRFLAANRLAEAESLCHKILDAKPHHGGALHALGLVHLKRRQLPKAVEHLRDAASRAPDNAQYHANLGEALRRSGQFDEALVAFRRSFVLYPEFLTAHLGIANTLRDQGHLAEAIAHLRVAVAIDHRFAEGYHYLGLALKENGDAKGALAVLRKAVSLKPNYTEAEMSLGNLLEDLARWDEATTVFEGVLAHAPNHAGALNNLGNIHRVLGRMDQAEACYQKILDRDPDNPQARYNLSRTRKSEGGDLKTVEEMTVRLQAAGVSDPEKVSLHFSLGKILDDLGEYDRAFAHFADGNRLDTRPPSYEPDHSDQFVNRLIALFDEDFARQRRGLGSESERPILIVGMPRSGTTLTEQILASHPDVYGGGERATLPEIANRIGATMRIHQIYPESMAMLDSLSACRLAEDYLGEIEAASGKAKRVTDKLPANFNHVGLFALLFPKARVIHCRRDPMDTCLSCYFQHFTQVMPFSRDQASLAHYYRTYMRIMDHWRKVNPIPILDVRYEDVVADIDGQTRRILEFCGLPWDDACLRFFETQRAIKTASVWQVRQPLYDSSVGRWKHYAQQLEPLRLALGDLAPPPEAG